MRRPRSQSIYPNLAPSVFACLPPSQSISGQTKPFDLSVSAPRTLACLSHFRNGYLIPEDADTTTQHAACPPNPALKSSQSPAHTAPLASNRTLSVAQGFIQAVLPILLVHLTGCDIKPPPQPLALCPRFYWLLLQMYTPFKVTPQV